MAVKERIAKLRELMERDGIDIYMVPTADFHNSEYVGEHFKARVFMSGFTGSAGTLVVTKDYAGLWTDGRYFLQAEQQLEGSGIELCRMFNPGVPTTTEFIEKNLGGDLEGTVIIVATSDDSSLMRKYGAFCAMSVAEYFKQQGNDVLFIMDSVTRFAMAQREIGLALGEPPTSKGYPPSSLTLLPQLMERAGKEEGKGSITAFFTVLVEGDDMSDPIADQSRSILDGHIVLSRELTDFGIYPPINIQNSASRVMGDVIGKEHKLNAMKFKRLYSLLKENEVLLRIGAYQKGSDKELDLAISKKEFMESFLKQSSEEAFALEEVEELLDKINQ